MDDNHLSAERVDLRVFVASVKPEISAALKLHSALHI
jgi:hypothetical protein